MVNENLGVLFRVKSGDGIAISKLRPFGMYPVYGGNGINGYTSNYNVDGDTLVIGRVGEKCGNVNITSTKSWVSDNALIVIPKARYNIEYLSYLLEFLNLNDYANRNAQPVISGQIIYAIEAPYEDDEEHQEEIACTLSQFDSYIDDLAELIEKKKGIRDGAINDLLSGKTRLKGFGSPWKESTLGTEFDVIMGSSPNSASYNSARIGVPLVQGNADIENRVTAPRRYTSMPTKICEIGDTILTVRAPVGSASRANQRVCLGRGVCAISGSHKDFIYYLMRYHESAWESIEQGSTFTAVSGKEVRKFEIKIPEEGREQDSIASILKSMDEEIRDLETERNKIIQIREGAMDDLLTGRVRLIK